MGDFKAAPIASPRAGAVRRSRPLTDVHRCRRESREGLVAAVSVTLAGAETAVTVICGWGCERRQPARLLIVTGYLNGGQGNGQAGDRFSSGRRTGW
jgi:hypothetical protein